MGTPLAYAAMLAWPIISGFLRFIVADIQYAILFCIIFGFLFLPSEFSIDFPYFPAIDKDFIIAVCLLIITAGRGLRSPLTASIPFIILFTIVIISLFLTVFSNMDTVYIGLRTLPAMTSYDILSFGAIVVIMIFPAIIGYNFFRTKESHIKICYIFIVSGLIYSLFMLYEIRMSPQLHYWIYGFRPRPFVQNIRFGGYRPTVFLQSGLWVAFYMFCVLMCAIAILKEKNSAILAPIIKRYALVFVSYFYFILIVTKGFGSILYGLIFGFLALLSKPRVHLLIALVLTTLALTYPLIRGAGLVPTEGLVELAGRIDPQRAGSLGFRFRNEDALLERAQERPVFGWGSWGRNRVYDPETGDDRTVTDGYWIIQIGTFGWLGYLAGMGLLALPILRIWLRRRALQPTVATSVLVLVLAVNLIELLPNSTLSPLTWLIAGALLGFDNGARDERLAHRRSRAAGETFSMARQPTLFTRTTRHDSAIRAHHRSDEVRHHDAL
jgi:hypothetical protein